jgi:hypothetical protein
LFWLSKIQTISNMLNKNEWTYNVESNIYYTCKLNPSPDIYIYTLTFSNLKVFQFIWNFLWQDKKMWPLNTGDCLIEMTPWAGFTVILDGPCDSEVSFWKWTIKEQCLTRIKLTLGIQRCLTKISEYVICKLVNIVISQKSCTCQYKINNA